MPDWMITIGDAQLFDARSASVAAAAAQTGTGLGTVMREHQAALRSYARDGGRMFVFATTAEIAVLGESDSGAWTAGKWRHVVARVGDGAQVVSHRAGRTSIGSVDTSDADFRGWVVADRTGAIVVAGQLTVMQDTVRSGLGALLTGGKGRATNEVVLRVGELAQAFASPGKPAASARDAAKMVLDAVKEARKDDR